MSNEKNSVKFKRLFPQFASRLSEAAIDKLLTQCSVAEFKAGRNIVRDKMPTDALYFVLSGDADIYVEENDKTIRLGQIKPGQFLGEVSILSRQMTASSTVQAVSDVIALKLKHQPLERLLIEDDTGPVLLELLSETLAARLRATH